MSVTAFLHQHGTESKPVTPGVNATETGVVSEEAKALRRECAAKDAELTQLARELRDLQQMLASFPKPTANPNHTGDKQ